ncbi:MAG: BON domain-containing protein [Promethearchaeota archaeon]
MSENQKDSKIKHEIINKLKKDKMIDVAKIRATVKDGIVILEGTLTAIWQKSRAEKLISQIKGVEEIINKLFVLPKKSVLIRELLSEDLSDERLIHIVEAHLSKLEIYFGLIGTLIALILIVISIILTPNYNPLYSTVSSLGYGMARTLFSIAFVINGTLGIPFLLYLEKTLVGINEFIRRIATGTAVLTCVCIALVGILPDPVYYNYFLIFHGVVAMFSFIGSGIYITLYSFLMLKANAYKKYHVLIGFLTMPNLLLLLIIFNPLVEWILTVNIFTWVLITVFELLKQ